PISSAGACAMRRISRPSAGAASNLRMARDGSAGRSVSAMLPSRRRPVAGADRPAAAKALTGRCEVFFFQVVPSRA
ncbi:hypothetical protein, partial [Enterobacter ludwigii]|uniref:hypothetical protein n=1 Tax=Enterobacter ludwigii TaxID=299767 RepID=UPI00195326C5